MQVPVSLSATGLILSLLRTAAAQEDACAVTSSAIFTQRSHIFAVLRSLPVLSQLHKTSIMLSPVV